MRRYIFILLFLVALLTPMVLRALMGMSASSAREAKDTLLIITAHTEGIRREFKDAFIAWHLKNHPKHPVNVDYRTFGAPDIVKYFDDAKRGGTTSGMDLVWGGGDYLFDQQLKKPGYLQAYDPPADVMSHAFPKADLNGVLLYDKDPKGGAPAWFGTALSSFGIIYNRDVLKHLGLPEPKSWRDLGDPKYGGWVVAADPTRSSTSKTMFLIIAERAMADAAAAGRSEDEGWAQGMGTVRLIGSNCRVFLGSSESVPALVASGDAAAGMVIDFYGRAQVDAVGERLAYVEPLGATAINPDPIALVKDAPHPELAREFIAFVLSDEGQALWNVRPGAPGGPKETPLRRLPVAPSAYRRINDFVDKVNPYESSGGFNKAQAREATFSILGELIEFSCIDLLDDLRETRAAILASKHAAELDAKLGRFPFDQKEAIRRLNEEWNTAGKPAPPARRLELQRQWTAEFREEYRKLREEARK